MIVRPADPTDKPKWNALVGDSPDSTYSHAWDWIDLIENHLQVQAYRLVAESDMGLRGLFGGFLIIRDGRGVRNLLGATATMVSPHELTWDYGGPCFPVDFQQSEAVAFLASIEEQAALAGAMSVRFSPFSNRVATLLSRNAYEARPRLTALVDLRLTEAEIWKRLRKTFRHCIRNAERQGLEARFGQSQDELPDILRCMTTTAQLRAFELPPPSFFHDLFQRASLLVRPVWEVVRDSSGHVLSAGVSLGHKDMITTRWSGSLRQGDESFANHFRLWSLIRWAREREYATLDLGGLPSDPTHGIYVFKSGIGGDPRQVDWYVKYLRHKMMIRAARAVRTLATGRTRSRGRS